MSGALARRVALSACRVAARLLPRPFRERFGDELALTVAERVDDAARAGGPAAALMSGAREALDISRTAVRLRTGGGIPMHQPETSSVGRSLDGWRRDLRHAARALARRPGFLAAAALTLALGIGANTAIYSLVNGVVLRPLPYERPDRLVMAWEDLIREGNHRFSASLPNYRDWRDGSTAFSDAAAQLGTGMRMRVGAEPELVRGARVTPNFFAVLGAHPALGRTLVPGDTLPGHSSVAVISHALWRRSFASSPDAVGRELYLDGAPVTVVGVMPSEFSAPTFFKAPHAAADVWLPLVVPPGMDNRAMAMFQVVARLRDGVTLGAARQQLSAVAARLTAAYPATNTDVGVNLVPMEEQIVGDLRPSLFTLLAASGFLLLIACANVANLFLARALDRRREVAIRFALGGGRGAVMRQWMAEGALVAAVGGALALAVGWSGMRVLLAFAPRDTVRLDGVRLDGAVLGFCLAVTALVGLGVGLLPALRGSRVDARGALGSVGERGSGRTGRFRSALTVAQMALAVILLAGAGLMGRTLTRLGRVELGFAADHLLTMRFGMSAQHQDTPARQVAYLRDLLARFERVPGGGPAAFSSRLPLDPAYGVAPINIEGQPVAMGDRPVVGARIVSDGYFRAMRIPVLAGRDLAVQDSAGGRDVVLVNAAFARRFWGSPVAAVGRRLSIGDASAPWMEVVGVVGDVAFDGVGAEPIAELYLPFAQSPTDGGALVVRTAAADPASVAGAIRRAALEADPEQALIDVRPMQEMADNSVAPRRFLLLLLGAFAGVALLLSAVGVYGVLAYVVGQSRREMGIRLALGAQRRDVLLMVAGRGAALAVGGAALGLAGAAALTRFLERQLYGVSPTDPATLGGVAVLLVLVAVLAALLPARRAALADPVSALRAE